MLLTNYQDPCLVCRYSTQACGFIMDGLKKEDACVEKLRWINYQERLDRIKKVK